MVNTGDQMSAQEGSATRVHLFICCLKYENTTKHIKEKPSLFSLNIALLGVWCIFFSNLYLYLDNIAIYYSLFFLLKSNHTLPVSLCYAYCQVRI